jgi:hypothetical protein
MEQSSPSTSAERPSRVTSATPMFGEVAAFIANGNSFENIVGDQYIYGTDQCELATPNIVYSWLNVKGQLGLARPSHFRLFSRSRPSHPSLLLRAALFQVLPRLRLIRGPLVHQKQRCLGELATSKLKTMSLPTALVIEPTSPLSQGM